MNSIAPTTEKFMRQSNVEFERVLFDFDDREFIADMSRKYEAKLGISFVAVKGFIRIAVRRWQIDYEMTVHELRELSFDEQRPHCSRIDEAFYNQLSSALSDGDAKDNLKKLVEEIPMMMSLLRSKQGPPKN